MKKILALLAISGLAACSTTDSTEIRQAIESYYDNAGVSAADGGFTDESFSAYMDCIAERADGELSEGAQADLIDGVFPTAEPDVSAMESIVSTCSDTLEIAE